MLASIFFLSLLGFTIGLILAFAANKFHIDVDQRVKQLEEALPGINCGACGYAGCSGYATAIVNDNAEIQLCSPGGQDVIKEISTIMQKDASANNIIPKTAYVFCQGGTHAKDSYIYNGVKTCKAASLYEMGPKLCNYGCLEFGDCIEVCQFDAIHYSDYGVPVVDEAKCTACGACVTACPKDLIEILPLKEIREVTCKSHDMGKVARQVCETACIGCTLCVKSCPYDAIVMDNNLAVINPEKCINCGICVEKCPTKAIL